MVIPRVRTPAVARRQRLLRVSALTGVGGVLVVVLLLRLLVGS